MKRPEHNKRPSDLVDHAGCTAAKCISHNLSNNLDSKHFSRFCTLSPSRLCDRVEVEKARFDKIIGKKQIPLLTFEKGRLQVKGYDLENGNIVFGALSHRWNDNILVSEQESYTPGVKPAYICQLKALQSAFDEVVQRTHGGSQHEHIPFWVDSLCTPEIPAGEISWSINQTRHIYKKATTVLV